jgi:hypothetical protein
MAVRPQLPWLLRWIGVAVLLVLGVGLADQVYDAGARFAGFERDSAERRIKSLEADLSTVQESLDHLRAAIASAESSAEVDRAARLKLHQHVESMEAENARLREDLALYQELMDAGAPPGPQVFSLHVERGTDPSTYRYRVLLRNVADPTAEFRGQLQLGVTQRRNGRDVMMLIPPAEQANSPEFRLAFRRFSRLEGEFRAEAGADVRRVEARVIGSGKVRASKAVKVQ